MREIRNPKEQIMNVSNVSNVRGERRTVAVFDDYAAVEHAVETLSRAPVRERSSP